MQTPLPGSAESAGLQGDPRLLTNFLEIRDWKLWKSSNTLSESYIVALRAHTALLLDVWRVTYDDHGGLWTPVTAGGWMAANDSCSWHCSSTWSWCCARHVNNLRVIFNVRSLSAALSLIHVPYSHCCVNKLLDVTNQPAVSAVSSDLYKYNRFLRWVVGIWFSLKRLFTKNLL